MSNTKIVSVTIPEHLVEICDNLANANFITFSSRSKIITHAIEELLLNMELITVSPKVQRARDYIERLKANVQSGDEYNHGE